MAGPVLRYRVATRADLPPNPRAWSVFAITENREFAGRLPVAQGGPDWFYGQWDADDGPGQYWGIALEDVAEAQ